MLVLEHFSLESHQKFAGLSESRSLHWDEIPLHAPEVHRPPCCLWLINVVCCVSLFLNCITSSFIMSNLTTIRLLKETFHSQVPWPFHSFTVLVTKSKNAGQKHHAPRSRTTLCVLATNCTGVELFTCYKTFSFDLSRAFICFFFPFLLKKSISDDLWYRTYWTRQEGSAQTV